MPSGSRVFTSMNDFMKRLHPTFTQDRRQFLTAATATGVAASLMPGMGKAERSVDFKLRYILGSSMYGYTALAEIVPQVRQSAANALDIWPRVHGNQREQLDELGEEKFSELLQQHNISLGCITQYKLGPFGLQGEMRLAARLGCSTIVTGGEGPPGLSGAELKSAVAGFVEKLKPHLAIAEETGVTIAIENHGGNIMQSPDAMKWLVELRPSRNLAIAMAPYHLPQDEALLSDLIRALGDGIAMFYAWQHGMGCHKKLPKEQELLQMPGRGSLDFTPLMGALRDIEYEGWTEIFMHPVPRGIPILDTSDEVTAEINRARAYVEQCLANAS